MSDIASAPELPLGQPTSKTEAKRPARSVLTGRLVDLVPIDDSAHGDSLFELTCGPQNASLWTYLLKEPPATREEFGAYLERLSAAQDSVCFAIVDKRSGRAIGWTSYVRIEPSHRVIEVGNVVFSGALRRTAGATEAIYLVARTAFEALGYRRLEWKCNSLNAASRRAALRFGFTFEGVFRQHMVVKGRNRDTAWFSMLDTEWPARKRAFEAWLLPSNFDAEGRQMTSLSDLNGAR